MQTDQPSKEAYLETAQAIYKAAQKHLETIRIDERVTVRAYREASEIVNMALKHGQRILRNEHIV